MAFSVQPAALRELAALVDRAGGDIDAAIKYLAEKEPSVGGEGVISQFTNEHKAALRTLSDWLGRVVNPTLTGVSAAVTASADYYQSTDTAAAEQLDSTYPTSDVTETRENTGYVPVEPPGGTAPFADVADPTVHLKDIKDYTEEMAGSTFDYWADPASPMAWAGWAIEQVSYVAVWLFGLEHPIRIQQDAVKPFIGDWAGVRATADILRNIADTLRDTGTNIGWGSQGVEQVWQGNAGNAAADYLVHLTKPLDEAGTPLDDLAEKYVQAARDMTNYRDALVGIVNAVGDAAIAAAVACGISAGATSTGVGAPVGVVAALFAAYEISRVADAVRAIFDVIGKLKIMANLLGAAQGGFADNSGDISLPPLPGALTTVPGR